jgi:hypothetical protein
MQTLRHRDLEAMADAAKDTVHQVLKPIAALLPVQQSVDCIELLTESLQDTVVKWPKGFAVHPFLLHCPLQALVGFFPKNRAKVTRTRNICASSKARLLRNSGVRASEIQSSSLYSWGGLDFLYCFDSMLSWCCLRWRRASSISRPRTSKSGRCKSWSVSYAALPEDDR